MHGEDFVSDGQERKDADQVERKWMELHHDLMGRTWEEWAQQRRGTCNGD